MSRQDIGLYVHIPFCAARCPYCDFATAPARSPFRARYLETLAREMELQGRRLGRPPARTLYFGGGTPSLLEPAELDGLMTSLRAAFDLRPVEFTIEANPATLAPRRLDAFHAAGVTRVSLGAQSLQPSGLKALARAHSVDDVRRSVAALRAAGVASLNLDLIFGWPGETHEAWRADLAAAAELAPDHLSCYPLTLELEPEEGVANWPGGGWRTLARWRAAARAAQPDDDALAAMYVDAERALARAGFAHYEIANWARPGHRCQHNLVYWRNEDWLGVGAGAHSHLGGRRFWNPGRMDRYLAQWERGAAAAESRESDPADEPHGDHACTAAAISVSSDGAIAAPGSREGERREPEWVRSEPWEVAMLSLRLREGLSFHGFSRLFGPAALAGLLERLRALDGTGLLRWRRDSVSLTRRGRLLSNEVFVRLLPDTVA